MKKEKGITLTSLVITIIILLIIASISVYSGTNLIKYAKYNKAKSEMETVQAQVNTWNEEYKSLSDTEKNTYLKNIGTSVTNPPDVEDMDSYNTALEKTKNAVDEIDDADIEDYRLLSEDYLKKNLGLDGSYEFLVNIKTRDVVLLSGLEYEGNMYYTTKDFNIYNTESADVTGIKFDLEQGNEKEIIISNVKLIDSNSNESNISKFKVQYKMNDAEYFSDVTANLTKYTEEKENEDGIKNEITKYKFKVDEVGEYTVQISTIDNKNTIYKDITLTAKVPTDTQIANADASTAITTTYGRIDVIWLDRYNKVISTPNAPKLGDMTKVTWTETTDGWTEDTTAKSTWYNYTAGTGNDDNLSSMWANAKDSKGSYFVWIPRYAYRITYYSDDNYTTPTGYYDGYGMWNADSRDVKYKLDSGIETVKYNENKYIVHPAFETNLDNGGWDSELAGFWMAKYEMSRNGATDSNEGSGYNTTFLSVPNVQSARTITIGNMYNVAKSYDTLKESHLIKNSEWGAVAYLTQSQYGRNGHEIDINNSTSYITGNGGGSTSASRTSGAPNPYNTTIGAKASTTGNVYGVYDMSGGAWEYVAAFNNTDTNNYESSFGSTFASTSGTSDKYATKYYNETTSSDGNARIYTYGKIGDATKEVNKGGAYDLSNTSRYNNWFGDYSSLCYAGFSFVKRGGHCNYGAYAGVFCSRSYSGDSSSDGSFRAVLCP